MTRPAELASFNVAHSDDANALDCIMHSPAARALLQPRALLHHPRDIKRLDLSWACYNYYIVVVTFRSYKTLDSLSSPFPKRVISR